MAFPITSTKLKLSVERQVFKLNNTERTLYEELHLLKAEVDLLTEQLEDLKDRISECSYNLSRVDIEKVAAQARTDIYIEHINGHMNEFDTMFAEERKVTDRRNQDIIAKEVEEEEKERLRVLERGRQSALWASEAAAIEEEANSIEQECVILRKRNHAIMLKLRRKLIQTEDARRALLNQQTNN